jgi:hypothetical protein
MRFEDVGIRMVVRTGRAARLLLAVAAVVLCVFLPSGKGASGQDLQLCTDDAKTLCKGVRPGGGRLQMCLKKNEAKLSEPCKKTVASVDTQVKEVGQACADDLHMYCPNVEAGGGRAADCLNAHAKQVSRQCKAKLMKP